MMMLAFVIYLFFFVFVAYAVIRQKRDIDILPSFLWCLTMVCPFMLQKSMFSAEHANVQYAGVMVFGFTLLLGDCFSGLKVKRVRVPHNDQGVGFLSIALMVMTVSIQIYHISIMPQIPWLEAHLVKLSALELAHMREESSKLLSVPWFFQYIFQYSILVCAPISILLLSLRRRYVWAAVLGGVTLFYSKLTTAKSPALMFVVVLLVMLYVNLEAKWKKRIVLLGLTLAVPVLVYALGFLIFNEYSIVNYRLPAIRMREFVKETPAMADPPFTLLDHNRRFPLGLYDKKVKGINHSIDYMVYRFLLTPAEVSHRWYIFYPNVNGGHIGWAGLLPGSRGDGFVHPANKVGRWAYARRHPKKYFDSVHAYASVDADAYARWGMTGVFVVAGLILLLRLFMSWLRVDGRIGDSVYAAFVVILAFNLPMASIFAVLVAQGALCYLLIPSAVWVWNSMCEKLRKAKSNA